MSDVLGATEPAATVKASAKSASRQPAHAKAWNADGFSDDCERALAAGVAIGRLMGASEVTLKKSTYEMTVTLKHSKEASMPVIDAKKKIYLEAAAAKLRRQAIWIEKTEQAPPAAMQGGADVVPDKKKEKKARARRSRREKQQRELRDLRERARQQPPQQASDMQDVAPQQPQPPPTPPDATQEKETAILREAVSTISSRFQAFGGTGARKRNIILHPSGERLPVTVQTGTNGSRWADDNFGQLLYEALRGHTGEQAMDKALNEFIKQIAAPLDGAGLPATTPGGGADHMALFS